MTATPTPFEMKAAGTKKPQRRAKGCKSKGQKAMERRAQHDGGDHDDAGGRMEDTY